MYRAVVACYGDSDHRPRRFGMRAAGVVNTKNPVRRILVVDDNADVADALCHLLEVEGFAATWAASGAEALDLLRRNPAGFGLIILDVMMPGMSGWQFLDHQLAAPELADVPVVVVTADREALRTSAAGRAAAALLKPVDVDVLLDVIRRHLPE
jgi:CheY-like chemotaxis protein